LIILSLLKCRPISDNCETASEFDIRCSLGDDY